MKVFEQVYCLSKIFGRWLRLVLGAFISVGKCSAIRPIKNVHLVIPVPKELLFEADWVMDSAHAQNDSPTSHQLTVDPDLTRGCDKLSCLFSHGLLNIKTKPQSPH